MERQAGHKRNASHDLPSYDTRTEKKARRDQQAGAVQNHHPATEHQTQSPVRPPAQATRDAGAQGQPAETNQRSGARETTSEIVARLVRTGEWSNPVAKFVTVPKSQTFHVGDQVNFTVEHGPGANCVDLTLYEFEYADGKSTTIDQQRIDCTNKPRGLGREVTEVWFTFTDAEMGTWKWLRVTCRPWADGPSEISDCNRNVKYIVKSKE